MSFATWPTTSDLPHLALVALAALLAGGAVGTVYFRTLRGVVAFYTEGRVLAGVGAQVARFVLLVGALAGLAWLGAMPLVAATVGIVVARRFVLRGAGVDA